MGPPILYGYIVVSEKIDNIILIKNKGILTAISYLVYKQINKPPIPNNNAI